MNEISIECKNVKVSYDLHSHKVSTLKEYVIMKTKGDLTKATKNALDGVNFVAKRGECVALIGHNGCGKSTLLKCIAGILKPSEGTVETFGRIAPMIELGAGFDPEMTGRENVYLSCSLLGLLKSEIDARVDEIEKFSELGEFFDAPVKNYSSGMYMRLGFASTTAISAEIVLIDEILSVGDENFQKKCLARINDIQSSGSTVILVSHDLNSVLNMANRAYVIDKGRVVFSGDTQKSVAFYLRHMDEKRFASLNEIEKEEELRRINLMQNSISKNFGTLAKITNVNTQTNIDAKGLAILEIAISVSLFQDFDKNVVVGFALNSINGVRIFGNNSKSLEAESHIDLKNRGDYIVKLRFANLTLASGNYQLTTAIHNHSLEQTIDIQNNTHQFRYSNMIDENNFDIDIISSRKNFIECFVEKKVEAK